MREIEVHIPDGAAMPTKAAIEAILRASKLCITLRGTLAACPGCSHWHLKRDRQERGVLELTLWPQRGRIWFSMQSGRKGDWVMPTVSALRHSIESIVAKSNSPAHSSRREKTQKS
jgi:hypothetical protein